jgi:hypothetical protein
MIRAGNAQPLTCNSGTYATSTSLANCTSCEAGKYASQSNAVSCTECQAGTFSTGTGMNSNGTCTACSAGKFTNYSGSTTCASCPFCYFCNTVNAFPFQANECDSTFDGIDACTDKVFTIEASSEYNRQLFANWTIDRRILCDTGWDENTPIWHSDSIINPWLRLDLGEERYIAGIVTLNTRNNERARYYEIWIGNNKTVAQGNTKCYQSPNYSPRYERFSCKMTGRYVFYTRTNLNTDLELAEWWVYTRNLPCSSGQYEYYRKCVACKPGTYSDGSISASSCTLCPAGKYGTTAGQSSEALACDGTCAAGLWSAPGSSSASACIGCVPLAGTVLSKAGVADTGYTDVPGYRVHQFKNTENTVTFSRDVLADVLILGGGGGGGYNAGGGGGAGSFLYFNGFRFVSGKTYTFTVGDGGEAGNSSLAGGRGGDSSIATSGTNLFIARGGGGGGRGSVATDGGSGGGASSVSSLFEGPYPVSTNVLSSISGYTLGMAGGGSLVDYAGGGGGAAMAGSSAKGQRPGNGGDGFYQVNWGSLQNLAEIWGRAYDGVAVQERDGFFYVAGGGGGGGKGAESVFGATAVNTSGGKGGGGNGINCPSNIASAIKQGEGSNVTRGKPNTGSGGGGGGQFSWCVNGRAGGSGLILVRYSVCQPCSAGTRLINAGPSGLCTACGADTYSWSGATACDSCPTNSIAEMGSEKCYTKAGKYPTQTLSANYPLFNIARGCGASKTSACRVTSSSNWSPGSHPDTNANDGNFDGLPCVTNSGLNQWFRIDFEQEYSVQGGTMGSELNWEFRLDGFKIWIGNDNTTYSKNFNCYTHSGFAHRSRVVRPNKVRFGCGGKGRYVFIHSVLNDYLSFNEVEFYLVHTPLVNGKVLIMNNDFASGSFWGLSESIAIFLPQNLHSTASVVFPTVPPVITRSQGSVGLYTVTFGDCPDTTTCVSGIKHCDKAGTKKCCVAGQYLMDGVDSSCQACPAGAYSTTGAATSCTWCEAGKYKTNVSSQCTACLPGMYSTAIGSSVDTCINCNTNCQSTQYEFIKCTSSTDRVCAACPTCSYCDGIDAWPLPATNCDVFDGMPGCSDTGTLTALSDYGGTWVPASAMDRTFDCTVGGVGPTFYHSAGQVATQWVKLDLGVSKTVVGVVTWTWTNRARNRKYEIWVGDDPNFPGTNTMCYKSPSSNPSYERPTCGEFGRYVYYARTDPSIVDYFELGEWWVYTNEVELRPKMCKNGTFNVGNGTCQSCDAGTFASAPNSTTCSACAPGTFANQSKASSCTLCSAGTFLNETGGKRSTDCLLCIAGKMCV